MLSILRAAFLLVAFLVPLLAQPERIFHVRGQVVDETGAVEQAEVILLPEVPQGTGVDSSPLVRFTDKDGRFDLNDVPAGAYRVIAIKRIVKNYVDVGSVRMPVTAVQAGSNPIRVDSSDLSAVRIIVSPSRGAR